VGVEVRERDGRDKTGRFVRVIFLHMRWDYCEICDGRAHRQ
jgi:hypothetical protein